MQAMAGLCVAMVGVLLGVNASTALGRGTVAETVEVADVKPSRVAPPPGPPAPRTLQDRLDELARAYGEHVGIAVIDVQKGWVAAVNGDDLFPQQSVSKLWVALTTLEAIDRGNGSLTTPVILGPEDRSVFNQPIAHRIGDSGYATVIGDLIDRALIQSDNAANDMLLKLAGGVGAVSAVLEDKSLTGIRLGADEKNLQSMIAGLVWRPEYGMGNNFSIARSRLPPEDRDAALHAYLNDPADGASPVGISQALAALQRGELLSPEASQVMIDTMARARTGPRRLKGGLPEGWTIAHKTGTGQDWRGASVGINDVGLITAPDGRTYAIAVMLKRTFKPVPARLAFMQEVTRAVVDTWKAEAPASVLAEAQTTG